MRHVARNLNDGTEKRKCHSHQDKQYNSMEAGSGFSESKVANRPCTT